MKCPYCKGKNLYVSRIWPETKYGCRDCPAREKCVASYRGSECSSRRWYYGIESDPKTKADKIRFMDDEHLASFLEGLIAIASGDCSLINHKKRLEWLRQPAESGENNG